MLYFVLDYDSLLIVLRLFVFKGKGMQLGKKFKIIDMFNCVCGDMGGEIDDLFFVVFILYVVEFVELRVLLILDCDVIYVIVLEVIIVKFFCEGVVNFFVVIGDFIFCVFDFSLIKIKFVFKVVVLYGVQFWIYLNVDCNFFNFLKVIQMSNIVRGFFVNNVVGVFWWRVIFKVDDVSVCLIIFIVWINKDFDKFNIIIEYELIGGDVLYDVSVVVFYQGSELVVLSFDVLYEVFGDMFEWNVGNVDEENFNGLFEFEVEIVDENDFFLMVVRFNKVMFYIDVDVSFNMFFLVILIRC